MGTTIEDTTVDTKLQFIDCLL